MRKGQARTNGEIAFVNLPRFFQSAAIVAGLSITVFAMPATLYAQTPAVSANAPLAAKLDGIIARAPGLKNALVGVQIRSLKTGQLVYEKNPDFALVPASNEKLLTSSTALMRLGMDFRYTTTLYRTGTIAPDGTLTGDLYLRGTGDPSFTSARLKTLADALAKAGVKRFQGRVIADATRFTDGPLGDGWQSDDEAYYYSAQFSALNCDENVVPLQVAPAPKAGVPALVTIGGTDATALGFGPVSLDYLSVVNTVITTPNAPKPEANVSWNRARAASTFLASGTLPVNAAPSGVALTIEDPATFTAYRLADLLPLAGVAYPTRRVGKGAVPSNAVLVATDTSELLRSLVVHFLKTSDNLYGEALLRTIGAEKGKSGNAAEGVRLIDELLREQKVTNSGLYIVDGSGLSRLNHVTPRTIVELLTTVDQKFPSETKTVWQAALPVGGVDGTLRNRFKNTPAQNNVRGKTGSLNGVSSLSGYVTGKTGERFAFSILMNHFVSANEARATQDALVNALIE